MSLRTRLVAAMVVLVVAALAVAGVVTHAALRSFLLDRTDQQLRTTTPAVAFQLFTSVRGAPPGIGPQDRTLPFPTDVPGFPTDSRPGSRGGDAFPFPLDDDGPVPNGTYAELREPDGTVVARFQADPDRRPPRLPSPIRTGTPGDERFATVDDHRVLVSRTPVGDSVLVVATPLDDVEATLTRLVRIELVVAALTVVLAGALALWAVRLGLRPLTRIESTAGAIAAGDLGRRVERAEPRTEVGRLGLALNAMLAQIEEAFAERRASEDRLRRFVADASHELRTPLTAVRGYAELFRRGAATRPEDLATAMRRIEEESARMGVLVDDLLLLARLDQGRPLDRQPVDLGRVAADAVSDIRVSAPDRPIELHVDDDVVVTGDEDRLRQVAANLLSNATRHTPPGTPVHVRVSRTGRRAVLDVADQGPGIPVTDRALVFERFHRLDPSRTRASGGTGLGLSIVDAITAAHGGSVAIVDRSDSGAHFRVELPLENGANGANGANGTDDRQR